MVTVATQLPDLPMIVLFPRVFDDGVSLLGLGDIVLPGLFLCFLFRFDHFNRKTFKQGYFLKAWIGYMVGLVLTLVMVLVLQRGQPALMYLVPCTLIPTLFFSWRNKEFLDLWRGRYRPDEDVDDVESSTRDKATPSDEVALLQDNEMNSLNVASELPEASSKDL